MKRSTAFGLAALTLALGPAAVGGAPAHAQAPAAPQGCSPKDGVSYICGVTSVEDIVVEPSGRWIVGTSYKKNGPGLYVIDARARTAKPAVLAPAANAGAAPYAGCPAPDFKALVTHGIELRAGRNGVHTLYVVNHGGRESIEVFSLDVRGAEPAIAWIGCLIPPQGAETNGIAALPDGALAVTKFRSTGGDAGAFARMLRGEISGTVYLWKPGQGFSELPGVRYPGDNGILASADGKQLFIANYGAKSVHRIALDGSAPPASVTTAARPDNIRWTSDGKILVTAHFVEPDAPPGPHGWTVDLLDPVSMTLTRVVQKPGTPEFDNATTAVLAGGQMWLGTFAGDRVAYMPAPTMVK
jgi:hypothetical protein